MIDLNALESEWQEYCNINEHEIEHQDIAIIGMACYLPEANTPRQFWENIISQKNFTKEFPEKRKEDIASYIKSNYGNLKKVKFLKQAYLNEIDRFDYKFFKVTPTEAKLMNPIQRIFLQTAYAAIEDAGYCNEKIYSSSTGVFVGHIGDHENYQYKQFLMNKDIHEFKEVAGTGNLASIIPSRISYLLNLKGPSMLIDTACSSSLVALHTAIQAIENGDCTQALVGATRINILPIDDGFNIGIESSDGKTKAFDEASDGTGLGEGSIAIIIKPLQKALKDKDHIYATIKGSAVNQDGASMGITAPNAKAQEQVIIKAWENARIDPETVTYIEAHGTGTNIGDPIEIEGITKAFRKFTSKKQFCGIGSVKTNIGHLYEASGLASVLKVVLALNNRKLPPQMPIGLPNEKIDFINGPVYLSQELADWKVETGPRRAGVSAFGFSGTNAHVVLEEYAQDESREIDDGEYIFTLSAKTEDALRSYIEIYSKALRETQYSIQDICYTLNCRRNHYQYRIAFKVKTVEDLEERLSYFIENGFEYKTVGSNERESQALIDAYIRGEEVNWNDIWEDKKVTVVPLPTYPFESRRCWWDTEKQNSKEVYSGEVIHDLCQYKVVSSIEQDIYKTILSVEDSKILQGHRVLKQYMLPGTAYIEMMVQIAKKYYTDQSIRIEDLKLMKSITVEETKEIQQVIKKHNDYIEILVISSNKENDRWIVHASAKVYGINASNNGSKDIQSLITGVAVNYDINPLKLTEGFIEFSEQWNCCKAVYKGTDYAIAEIEMQDKYISELEDYYIHPILLDVAFNSESFQLGEPYLPYSYKRIIVYRPISRHFYSYIYNEHESAPDMITYDIKIIDELGNICIEVQDYSLKKIDLGIAEKMYSKIAWNKSAFNVEMQSQEKEQYLLVGKSNNALEELKDSLQKIEAEVCVMPIEKVDIETFMRALSNVTMKNIVFMLDSTSLEVIGEDVKKEWQDIFNFFKVITQVNTNISRVEIILKNSAYIEGQKEVINPIQCCNAALIQCISKELPHLNIRIIDWGEETRIDRIAVELQANDMYVAYRNNTRYLPEIQNDELSQYSNTEAQIKEEGVYVITGGMGDIGIEVCEFIAQNKPVQLILLQRTPLPPISEWDDLIISNSVQANKLVRLQEIMKNGTTIQSYIVDICDYNKMKEVFETIKKTYKQINGVFHCAGVPGEGFFIDKTEEEFKRVIYPKALGAYYLHDLTISQPLDYFVLFSSTAAIIRFPGQSDYSGANAFLDGLAMWRRQNNKKATSINWPIWKNTGMGKNIRFKEDFLLKAITPTEGKRILSKVLSKDITNIIIGQWDYDEELMELGKINLSKEILAEIQNDEKDEKAEDISSVILLGREDGKYTPMEYRVGKIFGQILGYEEIGIYDNFYNLGGDSILAVKIVNQLQKKIDKTITIAEIFKYLSIYELAKYLEGKVKQQSDDDNILDLRPVEHKEYYEVSSEQKRMVVLTQFSEEQSNYNVTGIMEITGPLDLNKFNETVRKITDYHESLRTSFIWNNGELYQKIQDHVEPPVLVTKTSEDKIKEEIERFSQPFDLEVAPLFRIHLLQIDVERFICMFDMHHSITDGTSIAIFIKDFITIYNDVELPPLRIQYKDYAAWQKEAFKTDIFKKQEKYWHDLYADKPSTLDMPTDYPRPAVQSMEGAVIEFSIRDSLTKKIKDLANAKNTTLNAFVLAAYYILMFKYTGQEDIVIGSLVAGRQNTEIENVIGMFVNTLPIRAYPNNNKTFSEFLAEIKENVLNALENQNYRFEDLIEKMGIARDLSRNPLFDTMLIFQNTNKEIEISDIGVPKVEIATGDLVFRTYPYEEHLSKLDFTIEVVAREDEIKCYLEYCTKLFKEETMIALSNHYIRIFEQIVENPNIKLSEIDILPTLEKEIILTKFNNCNKKDLGKAPVIKLFEEQVNKVPDKTAIYFEGAEYTYSVLNQMGNQMAYFMQNGDVKKEQLIAIRLERGPLMVQAILGAWKIGAAYIPIDVNYDTERVKNIIQSSNAKYILTISEYDTEELQEKFGDKIIYLDKCMDEINQYPTENLDVSIDMNSLAYVFYTSGSTGIPKGAAIENIGMLNHMRAKIHDMKVDCNSIVAQNLSHCFDVYVWQTFAALILGATTYIYPKELTLDMEGFTDRLIQDKVTTLQVTPTYLVSMLDYLEVCNKKFPDMVSLSITGEAAKPSVVKKWFEMYPDIPVVNTYGLTETSDDVVHYVMNEDPKMDTVLIGKPIPNCNVYILDAANNLCPIGVKGEICIAGIPIGRGYLNNPEKTAAVFVTDPFEKDKTVRMYKTGDIGRWLPDGNLQFFGRTDYQIKIRGYRVELGEIENKITQHPDVSEVAVLDFENGENDKFLCAYYVANDKKLSAEELRAYLNKNLPDYLVPAVLIPLEKMPTNANGKIDRKVLPKPEFSHEYTEYVAPRNAIEEQLVEVWESVLGVKRISVKDNFFTLGGDSIKAIQMITRLKQKQINIPVQELFKVPTVAELAELVSLQQKDDEKVEIIFKDLEEYYRCKIGYYPQSLEPVVLLVSDKKIEEKVVRESIQLLAKKYDVLNASISLEQERYYLTKGNTDVNNMIHIIEVNQIMDSKRLIDYRNTIHNELLMNNSSISFNILRTKEKEYLLIDANYMVMDIAALNKLVREMIMVYENILNNSVNEVFNVVTKYSSYMKDIKEHTFKDLFNEEISSIQRKESSSRVLDNICRIEEKIAFEGNTNEIFASINEAYNTTNEDIIVTAMCLAWQENMHAKNIIWHSLSGQNDAKLEKQEYEATIGRFEYFVPMRNTERLPEEDLGSAIKLVKNKRRDVTEVDEIEKQDIKCIHLQYIEQLNIQDIETQYEVSSINKALYDSMNTISEDSLELRVMEEERGLVAQLNYGSGVCEWGNMKNLMDSFKEKLQEISAFCIAKETSEITVDDVQDISSDELEYIMGLFEDIE